MKFISFIIFISVSILLCLYCRAHLQYLSNYNIQQLCLTVIPYSYQDTVVDNKKIQTSIFLLKNNNTDTLHINEIRCQSADKMPIWNIKYLLPNQMDTVIIKSNFRYIVIENSTKMFQLKRTAIVVTNKCKQAINMSFRVQA